MQRIVKILMRRDGLSQTEAEREVREAKEAVMNAIEHGDDPEEVFMDMLQLEPDYIMELI